jgi:hypothetical protein
MDARSDPSRPEAIARKFDALATGPQDVTGGISSAVLAILTTAAGAAVAGVLFYGFGAELALVFRSTGRS